MPAGIVREDLRLVIKAGDYKEGKRERTVGNINVALLLFVRVTFACATTC